MNNWWAVIWYNFLPLEGYYSDGIVIFYLLWLSSVELNHDSHVEIKTAIIIETEPILKT